MKKKKEIDELIKLLLELQELVKLESERIDKQTSGMKQFEGEDVY